MKFGHINYEQFLDDLSSCDEHFAEIVKTINRLKSLDKRDVTFKLGEELFDLMGKLDDAAYQCEIVNDSIDVDEEEYEDEDGN